MPPVPSGGVRVARTVDIERVDLDYFEGDAPE
jgi:hypothetical protein